MRPVEYITPRIRNQPQMRYDKMKYDAIHHQDNPDSFWALAFELLAQMQGIGFQTKRLRVPASFYAFSLYSLYRYQKSISVKNSGAHLTSKNSAKQDLQPLLSLTDDYAKDGGPGEV